MSKFTMSDDNSVAQDGRAKFVVFGIGGGGGNAVQHMVEQSVSGVTFVCANTDRQALDMLHVPYKLQIGAQSNRGLGAGADPEVGREAAESDEAEIRAFLNDADMVFITAGMGGGTGTGAAPVVARIAKELGVLTVAVVTMPFSFEGGKRNKVAKAGIEKLSEYVDSIITIPNDKLMKVYQNLTRIEAFKKSNDVLLHAVQGISQAILDKGDVNVDFNDIRTMMMARGHAMMGIGRASGDDRARQAVEKAIRSPLLDDLRLENAQGLMVNVVSSEDLTMQEMNEIAKAVSAIVDEEEANIFFGYVVDKSMGEDLHVTVIATGLTLDDRPRVASIPQSYDQQATESYTSAASAQRVAVSQPDPAPQQESRTRTLKVKEYLANHQKKH